MNDVIAGGSVHQTAHLPVVCATCALRRERIFRPLAPEELSLVAAMKHDHISMLAGADIIRAGQTERALYTLFRGWAVRYCHLPNGSRQIIDILLPGDLIGLKTVLLGSTRRSVQALTPVGLCALDPALLPAMFRKQPDLALAVLGTCAEEAERADARLAVLGHGSAEQRVGYLLAEIYDRACQRGIAGIACPFPLRRIDLADAVGLSRVHVMRTLAKLRDAGLAQIKNGQLVIPDMDRIARYAGYTPVSRNAPRTLL